MIKWIKNRKNAGLLTLQQQEQVEMAKELFNMWDQTGKGVLPINELSE